LKNNAIKTLQGKHDADTVALWTERLEALNAEFAEEQKRRHEEKLRRQAKIAKAKEKAAKAEEEAGKAKKESTLTYRLGNAINSWVLRLSGHDVDTDAGSTNHREKSSFSERQVTPRSDSWRRGWDSNPRYGYPYNGFRVLWFDLFDRRRSACFGVLKTRGAPTKPSPLHPAH
jgi:hypothetical protein